MSRVRTTINPTEEIEVSDATRDDLDALGLLLENTRATTPAGLTDAAIRQVRERAYSPATRAGIEDAERHADAAEKRRAKRAAPKPRAAKPTPNTAAPAAEAGPAPDGTTDGEPASADTPPDTSGDVPADSTQES